jgi:hypothetical protein
MGAASDLTILAGPKAYRQVRAGGLNPDQVALMAGAAGGPKWLILGHLDRLLFSRWFAGRQAPLFLVGSSSGAWRFAAACHQDPLAAINRFEQAYIDQSYSTRPSPDEISAQGRRILDRLLSAEAPETLLAHPFLRLNVLAARCKGLARSERRPLQAAGLGTAYLANLVHRPALSWFFERTLFHDPRQRPPITATNPFPTRQVALSGANLAQALMASGSIPFIMRGVPQIVQAPAGVYRDGGIIDYHLDLPYDTPGRIVLMLHYTNRIVPGWFDKRLTWRRPLATHMQHVLLVTPSARFVARLPHGKIPDRNDFYRFQGRDGARVRYWRQAVDQSRALADAFWDLVDSGRIGHHLQRLPIA